MTSLQTLDWPALMASPQWANVIGFPFSKLGEFNRAVPKRIAMRMIRGGQCTDESALFAEFSTVLSPPEPLQSWVGLANELVELPARASAQRCALVIGDAGALLPGDDEAFARFCDIMDSVTREIPMRVLFQTPPFKYTGLRDRLRGALVVVRTWEPPEDM